MAIIILSSKEWHRDYPQHLLPLLNNEDVIYWDKKEDFTAENLAKINPRYVFIPHWSHIIPKAIYENYNCIIFHMTDLPYGRGGSPLQNLIKDKKTETKISAIQCVKELDAGDVYLKSPLSLKGPAEEIFIRASRVILSMIETILKDNPTPQPQQGEATAFKRRTPDMSNILENKTLEDLYDHIRMLDCPGYPKAFLELDHFNLEFQNATLENGELKSTVIIKPKQ